MERDETLKEIDDLERELEKADTQEEETKHTKVDVEVVSEEVVSEDQEFEGVEVVDDIPEGHQSKYGI